MAEMRHRTYSEASPNSTLVGASIRSPAIVSATINLASHPTLIAAIDCAIALASYCLAFWVRSSLPFPFTADLMPSERFFQVRHFWLLIVALQPSLMFVFDTYHDIRQKRRREFIRPVFTSAGLQALILIAVYFLSGNLAFPRTVFPLYWLFNSLGTLSCRWLIKPTRTHEKRRVLIVGSGRVAQQVLKEVERSVELGLSVVGIVSDETAAGQMLHGCKVLADRSSNPLLIQEHGIEEVILTPEASWKDRLIESITNLEASTQERISIVPSVYEMLIGRIRDINFHDITMREVIR